MSLRQRVNQIKDTDPDFFEVMVEYKELFAVNRKNWDDKRWERKSRDTMTNRIVKQYWYIEDACRLMWDEYIKNPEWNGEEGEPRSVPRPWDCGSCDGQSI